MSVLVQQSSRVFEHQELIDKNTPPPPHVIELSMRLEAFFLDSQENSEINGGILGYLNPQKPVAKIGHKSTKIYNSHSKQRSVLTAAESCPMKRLRYENMKNVSFKICDSFVKKNYNTISKYRGKADLAKENKVQKIANNSSLNIQSKMKKSPTRNSEIIPKLINRTERRYKNEVAYTTKYEFRPKIAANELGDNSAVEYKLISDLRNGQDPNINPSVEPDSENIQNSTDNDNSMNNTGDSKNFGNENQLISNSNLGNNTKIDASALNSNSFEISEVVPPEFDLSVPVSSGKSTTFNSNNNNNNPETSTDSSKNEGKYLESPLEKESGSQNDHNRSEDSNSLIDNGKDNTIKTNSVDPLARQLFQREKQVKYGYNTIGYANYVETVPKAQRLKGMPTTPDKHQKCSKRSWDGQVRKWRRQLHLYDVIPISL